MLKGQKSFRSLIIASLLIAATTITATASWTDYVNPFTYFANPKVTQAESPSYFAATLIDPATDGGFEIGTTFADNGWTAVNTSPDGWALGTTSPPGASAGTKAGYVSTNGGTTWTYSQINSVVHLYKDVTIPAGEGSPTLTFRWKVGGEGSTTSDWDNMKVFWAPTSVVPVANTAVSGAYQVSGTGAVSGMYKLSSAAYNSSTISLPGTAGNTYRLIFSWKSDVSDIANPPAAIDEVSLTTVTALSGTKTIDNTLPTAGNNYASFTAAINAVNVSGVDAGGVTFDVSAGQTFAETTPCVVASGSATAQIIFRKSGVGANPQIRPTGGAGTADFGACISGGDYITFDGIDINIASGSAVEYGYLVRNSSVTNGANNNTIQNTSITLNRANTSSIGILQSSDTVGAGFTPVAPAGQNSFNRYYNFAIQNVYGGIQLRTLVLFSPVAGDSGNEIGVVGGGSSTIGGVAAGDIGGGSVTTYGIQALAQHNVKIFGTEIRNVGVSGSVGVNGIWLNQTAGTSEVFGNSIHDIRNASTSATTAMSGIRSDTFNSAGHVNRLYNNFIWNITSGYTGAVSATRQIKGITLQLNGTGVGTTHNVDFNSVRLDGSGSPNISSSALYINTTSGPIINVRNNILANFTGAQAGVAKHYAIESASTTLIGPVGSVSNNNLLYSTNTNGFVGLGNATDRLTLANWQSATSQDGLSKGTNPQFISPTNLHINTLTPTEAESGGSYFAGAISWVAQDIDADTRNISTPDIGADEFAGVGLDLAGPIISYTPLANTASTSTRSLSVTITDASGVASGGLAPRIYQRKTPPGGGYVSLTCTGTSPNYTCDIDTAIIGTPAVADLIEYFIVAQDTVGNVSVSPSAGAVATDVLTVTTPPTTPSSYTIVGSVSGTLTADGVGGGAPNFASLTNAAGVFEYINNNEVTGNIVIEISADLTGENGGVALNEFASPHTILIKPVGGPRTITGSSTTSIIKLNGADRVRIDGSTAATFADSVIGGTPGLRELTVSNTNTGGTTSVFWIGTNASSGANNNIIRNLNMIGAGTPAAPSGQGVIAGSGATFGGGAENGRPNSNNTIRNTTARGVQNAVFTVGDAITLDQNWVVAENDFGSTVATEKLTFRGVAIQNAQNFTITENIISGISSSTATSATMSGILVGATLNGGVITKNQIRDIRQNNAVGWGSNGVFLNSTSAASGVVVANNFISDIASQGFNGFDQGDNGYGIMVNSGGGYSIYYNSVLMNANQVAAGGHSSALNVEDVIPAGGLDVRNNIFVSNQTVGNRYAVIHQGPTAAAYAFIDNNDYYSPSGTFNIGRLNGVNQTTLAGWQGVTGSDLNSISFDPLFTSATDLRTLFGTPVQDKGVAVSVLDDIDGNIRSVVGFTEGKSNLSGGIPDMGAKERLGPTSSAASVGGRVVTASGQGIRGAAIVVSGNSLPTPIIVKTGSLGYYQVDGLQTGETYVLTVVSKRFTFAQPSRVFNLTDNINDADFIANPLD